MSFCYFVLPSDIFRLSMFVLFLVGCAVVTISLFIVGTVSLETIGIQGYGSMFME